MRNKIKFLIFIFIIIVLIFAIGYKVYDSSKNIPSNYKISISPVYLNQPSNSLLIYDNYYIITYSYAMQGQSLIYYKSKIDENKVNEIYNLLAETLNKDENKDKFPFYSAKIKGILDIEGTINSSTINEIVKLLGYDGKIWYVTPN